MGSTNGGSDAAVLRRTGRQIQNETTGLEEPEWATVHTGPMRLARAVSTLSSGSRRQEIPGGDMQLAARQAHFPAAVTVLLDDDFIDITDGENAGTVWRIVEADFADQQTARRLPVVAEPRPSEWGSP